MAEAVRFELTIGITSYDELATRCFKPGSATLPTMSLIADNLINRFPILSNETEEYILKAMRLV